MWYFLWEKEEAERLPLYQNQGGLPNETKVTLVKIITINYL